MLGYAMILGAACLWGTWSVFLRFAERDAPLAPALEVAFAFALVLLTSGPSTIRRGALRSRPRIAWIALLVLGVGDALNALLYFAAMQTTTLAVAVLSHYLAPVLVAVSAPLLLGEPRSRATSVALALALGGLTLLLEPWRGLGAGVALGTVFGAGSAVFYAGNVLLSKGLARWFTPREVLSWHMPVALLALAPFVPRASLHGLGSHALLWLCLGGLLPGALSGVLFIEGLARVPASRASVLTLVEPCVAVLIGVALWHEPLRPLAALGVALVLGGAWRAMRAALG